VLVDHAEQQRGVLVWAELVDEELGRIRDRLFEDAPLDVERQGRRRVLGSAQVEAQGLLARAGDERRGDLAQRVSSSAERGRPGTPLEGC